MNELPWSQQLVAFGLVASAIYTAASLFVKASLAWTRVYERRRAARIAFHEDMYRKAFEANRHRTAQDLGLWLHRPRRGDSNA